MADPVKPAGAGNTPPNAPPVAPAQQAAQADRRVEQTRESAENARDAAKRKLQDEAKARHDANVEADQRRGDMKPTPTQEENDLAKLGHPVDEKEDDGSGPEVLPVNARRDASPDDPARYKTRDMSKK